MNNIFVYLEIEDGIVGDVSLELLTKGRSLANQLKCKLEAVAAGYKLDEIGAQVFPFGGDTLYLADDKRLAPYTTLPHTSLLVNLFKEEKPQIALMGATSIGRDLGPRVSSIVHGGLTADCTSHQTELMRQKTRQSIMKLLLLSDSSCFMRWKHCCHYRKSD
jgi:electron transfer flavoprotein alpha subunit